MNSTDYWAKRSEQIAKGEHLKADAYSARLKDEYRKAQLSINRDIDAFYARFAKNNEISFAEAQTVLTKGQLKDFKLTLQEFQALAMSNPDGRWTRKLNNAYFKQRVTRLEALLMQIENALRVLSARETEGLKTVMSNSYLSAYYQTQFMLSQGLGVALSFVNVDTKTVESVISRPWFGSNYSTRIWGNTDRLVQRLQTDLTQAIIRGDSNTKQAKQLADDMQVSFRQAERLIRTEASHIQNEASYDSYNASGVVGKYQYLSTLDNRTSSTCRSMDNKVFDLAEKQVSVTWPPLHANCRSTTVPYFEDDFDVGDRAAKDPVTGETYYVPADMKYEDWYNKHVVGKYGSEQVATKEKMIQNEATDKEQYQKYKLLYGQKLGAKSFAEFQDLKYNKGETWEKFKKDKQKTLNTLDYRDSFFGKFGDKEVREWYISHDKDIINKVNAGKPLGEQAVQAHSLRNQYRTEARLMMNNRKEAERLDKERPNISFDDLVADKMERKSLSKEQAYKDIINTSGKTNKEVNKRFGLE